MSSNSENVNKKNAKIYSLNTKNFIVKEGFKEKDTIPSKSKKTLLSILDNDKIKGKLFSNEGDIAEDYSDLSLSDAYLISLSLNESFFKVFVKGDPEEIDDDNLLFYLIHCFEYDGWVIGKLVKSLNFVSVLPTEIVAIRKSLTTEVDLNSENYLSANLYWAIDQILLDFDEKHPDRSFYESSEDLDDGDDD